MTTAGPPSTGGARLPAPDRVVTPWVDGYPPGVPPTYRWPSVPLARLLDDAARDFPDAPAAHDAAGTWSWIEVHARAAAFAAALARSGIGAGDRVGLATTRGPLALAVAFGTWWLGAVLVPVPSSSPTTRARVLAAARPRLSVVDADVVAGWFHVDHRVVQARPEDLATPGRLRRLLVRRGRGRGANGSGPTAWQELVGGADATAPPDGASVDPATIAVLLPSRDRAGRRRLVALSHRSLVANVLQTRLWIPDVQAGREAVLCPSPVHTPPGLVGGLLLGALTAGALVATDAAGTSGVADLAPTLLVADGADLEGLVGAAERRGTDLSSLRAGLVAGELPADLARRLLHLSGHARVRQSLGLPEACFLTHANPVYGRADPAQVGLPVTGTVAAVVDPADPTRLRPDGHPGRLVVAGPQVMAGYWQDPEASARVLHDGWLRTDLLAVRDATGAFAIVDAVGDTVGEEVSR